ncbi:DUF6519 domain-containing protein [Rhizobium sullae]|uniref:DUF6519 domain-containing protein n=1 Tax=Rhizobium sullae TaxID=50338 RepID=A0ABY5XIP6_RHISU|nr:DUF6519 domain-containing protein [Rhizobium sullae]UWU14079.1 DUF6519 domain-containing protein [Rhizobium sullae]
MTIRADATRQIINSRDPRPLRAVAPRQGQVLLDADFDQDARLTLTRIDGDMSDVIGAPGRLAYPSGTSAFAIQAGGGPLNLSIQPGHGFLDGWRLDNMAACTLATQPHPRNGDAATLPSVVAIKALIRHVDPVEEPAFADKALGDAQASGRLIADWQVLPQPVHGSVSCATAPQNADWLRLTAPSSGSIAVTVQPSVPGTDPCSLMPQGGYTRLENLLYRLEVHGGVPIAEAGSPPPLADGPRFGLQGLKLKLSRRNASLLVAITGINGNEITVSPPSLDPRSWFAPGSWAEIVSLHDDVDPRAALTSERLFRVALATDEKVTVEATTAAIAATGAAATGGWFLRFWDVLPDSSGLIVFGAPGAGGLTAVQSLGDGLSIQGGGGAAATFRRGDYWTFAARADGTIDWPSSTQQTPHGPETRYAPLSVATGSPAASTFDDCRIPCARLTDRVLHYRGGDGQAAFSNGGGPIKLAAPLRLAVLRGSTPVPGAIVQWSLPPGAQPSMIDAAPVTSVQQQQSTTNAQGEVSVSWTIDGNAPSALHQIRASLLGAGGAQPVTFTARFDQAKTTSYDPLGCEHLKDFDNVQAAIDGLCGLINTKFPVLKLARIDLFDPKGKTTALINDKEETILNGLEVDCDSFLSGIAIGLDLDDSLNLGIQKFDPILELELELPYPTTDADKVYWLHASQPGDKKEYPLCSTWGFQRIRLDGDIRIDSSPDGYPALIWTPHSMARTFLETARYHRFGQRITGLFAEQLYEWWKPDRLERILCRLRLRSAHIWADINTGKEGAKDEKRPERVYLNAEHLGCVGSVTGRELSLRELDPQRAADLDMFFYLKVPQDVKRKRPFRGGSEQPG